MPHQRRLNKRLVKANMENLLAEKSQSFED